MGKEGGGRGRERARGRGGLREVLPPLCLPFLDGLCWRDTDSGFNKQPHITLCLRQPVPEEHQIGCWGGPDCFGCFCSHVIEATVVLRASNPSSDLK